MRRALPAQKSVSLVEGGCVRIPAGVHILERFRSWSHGDRFPEQGRIDYLQGDVEVDTSPEDLFTHGTPKAAIGAALHALVVPSGKGLVFIDRTRIVSTQADLSVEPDVVVVLRPSLTANRVRPVPSSRPGRYLELEGAPDLVVEVLSDSSVGKDRTRLPKLYARAGIPELWLADARGEAPVLEIWTLGEHGYTRIRPDTTDMTASPALGLRFRLRRNEVQDSPFLAYELESAPWP